MNRTELLQLWRACVPGDLVTGKTLENFANKLLAQEREECARGAESLDLTKDSTGDVRLGDVDCIAAWIRTRSNTQ